MTGGPLVRSAQCPQCGGPMTFGLVSSTAQICKFCGAVVVRTDRDLRAVGRVAQLLDLASPFQVGAAGRVDGRRFRIGGRVQYDRAGAPGAPWQEMFVEMDGGAWMWLAQAQGRWYQTSLVAQPPALPGWNEAGPGVVVFVPGTGGLQVTERGQRRAVSGEGELPFAIQPGAIESYADLSGPGGLFGTIDYGDGRGPPQLFLGREIDPRALALDVPVGMPGGAPEVKTAALTCPGCGANLPLAVPDRTERIACRYCGMLSDVNQGALVALKQLPKPPFDPEIPLGQKGTLAGEDLTCIGFLVRGTTVEDERYGWREYLLFCEATGQFRWLMEEDGGWQRVLPISAGDVQIQGGSATYQGWPHRFKQSVRAEVEHVAGEFYWKVEAGETVTATEYEGAGGKISQEQSANEVNYSYCAPVPRSTVFAAFGLTGAAAPGKAAAAGKPNRLGLVLAIAYLFVWLVVSFIACGRASDKVVFDEDVSLASLPGAGAPAASAGASGIQQEAQRALAALAPAADDPVWGNPGAPVTIYHFCEFEFASCARSAAALAKVRSAYGPAKVRIVWKHNPARGHPAARVAAEAGAGVMALAGADAFWKFHDLAFQNQTSLSATNLAKWAAQAGVRDPSFRAKLEAHAWSAKVDADRDVASKLLAFTWPYLVVGRTEVKTEPTLESLKPVVDAALASSPAPAPSASAAGAGAVPPAGPDPAVFTRKFPIQADGRNLKLEVSTPEMQNSWLGADLALIHDDSGAVYETSVDLEFWSGVDGGESWSEGSRAKETWFSRLPAGQYLIRFEPAWEPGKPAPKVHLRATSDTTRDSMVFLGLMLAGLLGFGELVVAPLVGGGTQVRGCLGAAAVAIALVAMILAIALC